MVRDGNGAGAQTLVVLLGKEQRMQDVWGGSKLRLVSIKNLMNPIKTEN